MPSLQALLVFAEKGAVNKVRRALGAGKPEEIVFVHGATEAINFVLDGVPAEDVGRYLEARNRRPAA
jgi:selenocysteine lyase/cysteine desulfurase